MGANALGSRLDMSVRGCGDSRIQIFGFGSGGRTSQCLAVAAFPRSVFGQRKTRDNPTGSCLTIDLDGDGTALPGQKARDRSVELSLTAGILTADISGIMMRL